jgi:hypothetical protein
MLCSSTVWVMLPGGWDACVVDSAFSPAGVMKPNYGYLLLASKVHSSCDFSVAVCRLRCLSVIPENCTDVFRVWRLYRPLLVH